ncbi:MAG: hypothetical protein LBT24_00605 [Tannerella sp.]|jgi:hypothetical protein|nr:hypothetical protein [Tannerella sp.]
MGVSVIFGIISLCAVGTFIYLMKRRLDAELERLNGLGSNIDVKDWFNTVKPALIASVSKQDEDALQALDVFVAASKESNGALETALSQLNKNLESITGLMSAGRGLTIEDLTNFLNDNMQKISALYTKLESVGEKIVSSYDSIISITGKQKVDINALNKQAALITDIKKSFAKYQSGSQEKELAHLTSLCDSLEANSSAAFVSVAETLKACTEKLSSTFDEFYALCQIVSQRTQFVTKKVEQTNDGI